jgi:Rho-binding antiterminator
MQPKAIACDIHDLIEIICMRRYQVEVSLHDGGTVRGTASNTLTRQGEEFLLLELPDTATPALQLNLVQISLIRVLTPGAQVVEIRPNAAPGCQL